MIDYDSYVPGIEDIPTDSFEEEVVPGVISSLRCPFCSTSSPFNQTKLESAAANLSCPSCSSKVPTVTIVKVAGNNYASSLEILSEDNTFVEDLKGSLKAIKDYGDEDK